jgi:C-5 cytosine-specific DNA methylase
MRVKPRLLDLFCGAGGAAMGYSRAGFEVVGVDIRPQPNYPFAFVQADLRQGLDIEGDFDVIHASPPCQRWSTKTKNPENHPDLIAPTRRQILTTGLPYVIENVPHAPLRWEMGMTHMLCGSMFGLGVRRHRWFESNMPMLTPTFCRHDEQPNRYRLYDHGKWYMSSVVHVFGTGGGKGREHWQEAMGIDWTNDTDELREAIPPAYTELIGHQLIQHLQHREAVA